MAWPWGAEHLMGGSCLDPQVVDLNMDVAEDNDFLNP